MTSDTGSLNVTKHPVQVTNVAREGSGTVFTEQNMTVNATVENTGSSSASKTIAFKITDPYGQQRTKVSKSVTLKSGETGYVEANVTFSSDGTNTYSAGSSGPNQISVAKNPIETQSLSLSTEVISTPGDSSTASVSLKNNGNTATDRIVELSKDGSTTNSTEVSLAPGATTTVQFVEEFKMLGGHQVSAGMETGRVDVTDPDISVTNLQTNTTSPYTNEAVNLTATINNTGSSKKTVSVVGWSTSVDSGFESQFGPSKQPVTIPGGGQKNVSFVSKFRNSGTYNLTVNDGANTTVTVQKALELKSTSFGKTVLSKGESTTLNITYDNPTSTSRSKNVFLWNGTGSQTKQISVGANSQKRISFSLSYDTAGEKYLFVDGKMLSVQVLDDTSGTPNVNVRNTVVPAKPVNGTSTQYFVELNNTGDADAVRTVNLTVGGSVVDQRDVLVEASSTGFAMVEHTYTTKKNHSGYLNVSTGYSEPFTADVRGPVVKDGSVTIKHVNGTQPSQLPQVSAQYDSGFIGFQITNGQQRADKYNLSTIGADTTTEFRVNLTVDNYSPRVMASNGRNLTWTKSPGPNANETNISITLRPAQLDYKTQFEGGYPSSPSEWDAAVKNDTADYGWSTALRLGIGNAKGDFFQASPSDLDGMTVSTDAQMFSMPTYIPAKNGQQPGLRVPLAGPHKTVNGNINQGYYKAFLPQSLLDSWGVTNPSTQLAAQYQNSNVNMNVNDVNGGAYVNISLHYSSGQVTISKTDNTAPTADAGSSVSGTIGSSVSFDAASSSDNVGITTYEWDFDNDGSYDTSSGSATTSHTFQSSGTYTVTVRVSDGAGNTDTDTVTASISSSSITWGGSSYSSNSSDTSPSDNSSSTDGSTNETSTVDDPSDTDDSTADPSDMDDSTADPSDTDDSTDDSSTTDDSSNETATTDESSPNDDSTTEGSSSEPSGTGSDGTPGFGPLVTLLSLGALISLARRLE
ncbi:PKD domain-containing protein [Natrinema halophilum]|uniref:PKD domain-containing protein n=1 Tax=Natrinema halophilum TaxID=1699371 RepID=A0A7D5L374_9EURY|nr:PKD domain-containing protein [Natrinema halophilum]QLG47925.1 PKD domain-containing protein [Natrinema halophilum]